jgi:uncharacterized protein (TIGR00290 family)
MSAKETAVAWSGGKDSVLACYLAMKAGRQVSRLITFAPLGAGFKAHPLRLMELQAKAAGIPHTIAVVDEPYGENYVKALAGLKRLHISCIVTGDIDEVSGHPNFMEEYCRSAGMALEAPLWQMKREEIFSMLMDEKIDFSFTCVQKQIPAAAGWVGKKFNDELYWHLVIQSAISGMDLCGENGEYHTMVTNAPFFNGTICLNSVSVEEDEKYFFARFKNSYLRPR